MHPTRNASAAAFVATAHDGTPLKGSRYDGTPNGERLVLVHSLAMDRAFWDNLIPSLPETTSIIAYDCRGHGTSGKPSGSYDIETFGDDVAAVLDAAGWETAVVAGASMGGSVALAFAQRHQSRARGLALIDTTAWYGENAPAAWATRADKAATEGLGALIDFQVTRWFTDSFRAANPKMVQDCVDALLVNDIPAYSAVCRMLGAMDLRAGLSALTIPVSIVVGEEDYATPVAMAEAMQQRIPGATLTVAKNARHLTPVEIPDLIAAELVRLLERTKEARL